jgi:hypothetical protein
MSIPIDDSFIEAPSSDDGKASVHVLSVSRMVFMSSQHILAAFWLFAVET